MRVESSLVKEETFDICGWGSGHNLQGKYKNQKAVFTSHPHQSKSAGRKGITEVGMCLWLGGWGERTKTSQKSRKAPKQCLGILVLFCWLTCITKRCRQEPVLRWGGPPRQFTHTEGLPRHISLLFCQSGVSGDESWAECTACCQ